jgi:hypothetical protein
MEGARRLRALLFYGEGYCLVEGVLLEKGVLLEEGANLAGTSSS